MKKRLITASVLLLVLGAVLGLRTINTYGIYIFDLFIGILAVFSALEFAKLLKGMGFYINEMSTGLYPSFMFAGHVFYFLFNLNLSYYFIIQLSLLLIIFLITFITNFFIKTKEYTKYMKTNKLSKQRASFRVSLKTFLTFIYPTSFLLAFMLLNRIDALGISQVNAFSGELGWLAITLAFLVPIITDSVAMLFGMLIKGPKLCPNISPKKTVSGAVSAVVLTSLIIGALFYLFNTFVVFSSGFIYLGIKSYHFVLLGFLGSIVSQAGDIFESFLKRRANLKDSGNLFPGHGGVLDRLDSHIFSAPFVLIYLILVIII